MGVSNQIQFNSISVGDVLCRYAGQDVKVLGQVVKIATNRRGQRVAVLDRSWTHNGLQSDRIRETTVNRGLTVRKMEG